MLKTVKSLPSPSILVNKAIKQIERNLGIEKLKYRPYYSNFRQFASTIKKSGESKFLKKLEGLIIDVPGKLNAITLDDRKTLDKIINLADSITNNNTIVFDKTLHFPDEINWHISETGKKWPKKHFSEIKNIVSEYGDIKYTWELNRLSILQTLSSAYLYTQNTKYAKKAEEMINSWIDENPPEIGVNWSNDQELSYRIISLVIALQVFRAHFSSDTILKAIWIIIEAGRHISKEIEFTKRCILNNHIIGASVGLIISGYLAEEFLDAGIKWYKKGKKYLFEALELLFNDDGSYKNLSLNYQMVGNSFMIVGTRILKKLNDPDLPTLKKVLLKSARYLEKISVDGYLPQIGAWDSGKPIALVPYDEQNCMYICNTAYKICGVAYKENLLTQFFGARSNSSVATEKLKEVKRFSALNGINFLKKGNSKLYLITGDHPIYSQRHSDFLGILWYFDKYEILGDSGNYKYTPELSWNHYFRSSFAHNCLVINNKSNSEPYHYFRWLNYPKAELLEILETQISGILKTKFYTHTRTVSISNKDTAVTVIDKVQKKSSKSMCVSLFFQIPEAKKVEVFKNNVSVELKNRFSLDLTFEGADFNLFSYKGSTNPIRGWKSLYYGEKHPSLTIEARTANNTDILTLITKLTLTLRKDESN